MKLRIALIKQVLALLPVLLLVFPMVPPRAFGQAPLPPAGYQMCPGEFQSGSMRSAE